VVAAAQRFLAGHALPKSSRARPHAGLVSPPPRFIGARIDSPKHVA
jgi:hypothetical protein